MTDPTPPPAGGPAPSDVPTVNPERRPLIGSRSLAWLGVFVTLLGVLAEHREILPASWGKTVQHLALIGGVMMTAMGGAVYRPTNQRRSDRGD